MPNEKRGQAALFDALKTKGTAFSEAERRKSLGRYRRGAVHAP